jgi:hypothetical protein
MKQNLAKSFAQKKEMDERNKQTREVKKEIVKLKQDKRDEILSKK